MPHSIGYDEQERKLFVGGLSKEECDEDSLKEFFGTYGSVVDVTVMRDQEQRSRGFGFVVFDDVGAIDKIMSLKREGLDFVIKNNTVELKRALPQVPGGKAVAPRADYRKVFVGGLPMAISESEIKSYFEQFGRVQHAELPRHQDTNKLKGFAFVTFMHEDIADKCILRRNHEIGGKQCEVKKATLKSRESPSKPATGPPPAGEMAIDEVDRLIQQAFLMGQQNTHGSQNSQQAQNASASLLSSFKNPPPPTSNQSILMQALASIAAAAPPPPPTGVSELAKVLKNSGVDANALAGLLKGDAS